MSSLAPNTHHDAPSDSAPSAGALPAGNELRSPSDGSAEEVFDADDVLTQSQTTQTGISQIASTAEEAPVHFSHRSSEFEDSDKKLVASERTSSGPETIAIDEAVIPSDNVVAVASERETVITQSLTNDASSGTQNRQTTATTVSPTDSSSGRRPSSVSSLPLLRATVVEEPSEPVFEGVQVPFDEDLPFWKRHLLLSLLVVVSLIAVIVVAVIVTRNNNGDLNSFPAATESLESPSSLPSMQPSYCGAARVTGTLFETFCNTCSYSVDMDNGDVVTGSYSNGDVQFFRHVDGIFEDGDTFNLNASVTSVAISGDTAVIGTFRGLSGQAHIFEKDSSGTWSQVMEVYPDEDAKDARFGQSVDIDKNVIVIGAPKDDVLLGGSTFVYRRLNDTWLQETKLVSDDPVQAFGQSVAVKGDLIAVSDPFYGDAYKGAVFIYQYDSASNSWDQSTDGLIMSDECDQIFGSVVEFAEDNELMIGCYVGSENPMGGLVLSYSPSGEGGQYEPQQAILSSDVGNFGEIDQIAVDGDLMLVTANVNEIVFLFARENNLWEEVAELSSPDSSKQGLGFGYSLGLSGRTALVSSNGNVYSHLVGDC
jgi:hypothetical protein